MKPITKGKNKTKYTFTICQLPKQYQRLSPACIQGNVHKVTYNMGQFKQYNSIAIQPKIN